ncbi:hypothetical protein SAMN05660826_01397 [Caldanaerovirga acetigignens]|uniref:Uncharacterized protein n=2 Tax=Caldanaerovirga acetigignens TaxID=447595 RepID=A0A1M7JYJ5_9FIRM|nr:hypothetical protein SAMN05660826_01397 [Caldanaerovirga acetigignens]
MAGSTWNNIILEESALLLKKAGVKIIPCYKDYVALDIDVSPL